MALPKPRRSLEARALQWLSQREHSRCELRRKLLAVAQAQAGADAGADASPRTPCQAPPLGTGAEAAVLSPAGQVDALLDWLEAHQYLSQQRFVESRVHARAARFGNLRIRQELAQHQLALPADAARALQASETQRARIVRERKFAALPATAIDRAKQARFLAGRGFSPKAIERALRATPEPADGADEAERAID